MNQLFKLNNEKGWKTLLVTDDSLRFVNKSYSTEDEFLEKFNEKGLFKERLELSVLDVTKITYAEKHGNIASINYLSKENNKDLALTFESEAEMEQFIQAVIKHRKMVSSVSEVSTLKAIGPSLIGLGVTALLTWIVYMDAQVIENGGEVNTSGRRSLYKKLFAWLAEQLGTQGTLIAGGIIGLICIYFVYKNLQSKPTQVVYE